MKRGFNDMRFLRARIILEISRQRNTRKSRPNAQQHGMCKSGFSLVSIFGRTINGYATCASAIISSEDSDENADHIFLIFKKPEAVLNDE